MIYLECPAVSNDRSFEHMTLNIDPPEYKKYLVMPDYCAITLRRNKISQVYSCKHYKYLSFDDEVDEWIKNNNIRYNFSFDCPLPLIKFYKKSDALLFKLAWGGKRCTFVNVVKRKYMILIQRFISIFKKKYWSPIQKLMKLKI